jgi:transcriptional regulator with XRE-family HTH domain
MRHLNVIGPQVRRLRSRRGWSQKQLAIKLQLAGMDYATRGKVCKIESREVWVSDDDMLFIARVLGVEPNDLYPERLLHASGLYDAITAAKASRHGDI